MMEEGQVVGEWRCVRILGRGSFGIVGFFKHSQKDDVIALKQFDSRQSSHESPDQIRVVREMEDRWRKEVGLMYEVVRSPYIVSTLPLPHDFTSLTHHLPLLAMEFCSGGDLRQLLRRPENISGLPEATVRHILSHVQQAISYLHDQKIVHRDLKPENILIQLKDGVRTYKLSDLGLAKNLSSSGSFCSTVVGTLQYLAPEIYVGKKYDETVDFWSFGLIAFEIASGMRPFLHGESPARWYPYVEAKAQNVIAIYRAESGGGVEYATSIPYNTHLSDLFKKCLETWLKMMLQFEPKRRGRKVLMTDKTPDPPSSDLTQIVGLTVLHNILTTPLLPIYCPARKLAFAIGRSTTLGHIQNWILRDLGVALQDQLLLSTDGTKLLPTEHALKYYQSVDLFMIPRTPSLLQMKLKIPKCVNKFLTAWETVKDPLVLRKVWISAVFFIKTEVEQMEMLKKANEALQKWRCTSLRRELKPLKDEVEKSMASFSKILEFEKELEKMDGKFESERESGEKRSEDWEHEKTAVESEYEAVLGEWTEEDLRLKPLLISELEDIYLRILRTYEEWRESSDSLQIESLVRSLCLFIAQRDPVVQALGQNITGELERVEADERVKERLSGIQTRLNQLMLQLITTRTHKQSKLLQRVFAHRVSVTHTNNTNSDLPNTHHKVVGGDLSFEGKRGGESELDLDLSSLMHQSQILDLETDDTLSSALKQAEDMLIAKEKMDWEFLG